jgi:hypothetical protein
MSKFGLISGLAEDAKTPKVKYQLFEVEMGFEKATVLIPYIDAEQFETRVSQVKPKSISALSKLAEEFGGSVQ